MSAPTPQEGRQEGWRRRLAGLGLGLMISRRIVREFGGELSAAHNADDSGATFVMTLPAAQAPQASSAQETTA